MNSPPVNELHPPSNQTRQSFQPNGLLLVHFCLFLFTTKLSHQKRPWSDGWLVQPPMTMVRNARWLHLFGGTNAGPTLTATKWNRIHK